MKIIVFVKQVPDTDDVKLDPKTGNLQREGVQSIMNPLDANAVETALRLKEKYGGSVVAVSDESALLSDRALGGADTLATGYPLAKAAEKIGDYDLLICGRHATDAETAQTGPIIAAFLGVPQVTLCGSVEIEDGWAVCERLLPDRVQKVRVKLPALITVCAEANEPRYPTPIGIMKALKKPRYVWTAADLGCEPDMIGIPGSPSINKRVFEPPKRNTDTKYFTGSVEEMASAIADTLEAERLI